MATKKIDQVWTLSEFTRAKENGELGHMSYVTNAPPYLVYMHYCKKEGQALTLLGALLTDPQMQKVWERLGRKITTKHEWLRLWQEIKSAIFRASPLQKPKRVNEEEDDLRRIATQATELARVIEIERGRGYKGFFNFDCHQFCSDEVMKLNGVTDWSLVHPSNRYAVASKVMRCWPRMSELLDGLALSATKRANEVATKRVVSKDKGRWSETMFVRTLWNDCLSNYQWTSTDSIYAAIATITNLATETKFLKVQSDEGEVTAKFVRKKINIKATL